MSSWRLPSASRSSIIISELAKLRCRSRARELRGPAAGDSTPHGPDRQAKAREVARGQDVAGHDLARAEDVRKARAVLPPHFGVLVDLHPEVGERDPGTHRDPEK